jgi:hypothetical protein
MSAALLVSRAVPMVQRIPLFDSAQLLAASLLALQARRAGDRGWLRIWCGAALTLLAKVAVDALDLTSTGSALARVAPGLYLATSLTAVVLLGYAIWMWQSGRLQRSARLERAGLLPLLLLLGLSASGPPPSAPPAPPTQESPRSLDRV